MNLKLTTIILLLIAFPAGTGIYSIQITCINGSTKSISAFQGKKLLVVVLPVTNASADSQYLYKVDSFSKKYSDSMNVIGVPAYEYGYQDANLGLLKQYYGGIIGPQVTLTQGMYVMKASGAQQHPLFSWLTNATQNGIFDKEVNGVGQKYFVSGNGELYGVLSSYVTLRDSLMVRMLY